MLWDKLEHKVYHHACAGVVDTVSRTLTYNKSTNTIYLKFEPKNKYLHTLVQQVASAYFNEDTWTLENPDPVSAKQLLDLAESYNFNYNEDALDKLAELITLGTHTMLQSMSTASTFKVKGLLKTPFPFQETGVEFGVNNKRVIIADQMGLGKTIQAMGILTHLQLFPAIIVCPAIIKLNWQREILAWISGINPQKICTLSGRTSSSLPKAEIYIVNYDILVDWLRELQTVKPKAIIFDEFHYLKTSVSRRGKAARILAKNQEYIIGLTGTPILNRPEELIHPLRILGRLREMGGKEYFEKRYCDGRMDSFHRWNTSGASNLKELNERLRASGILIRRNKNDVLPDLPKKLPPTIITIELTNRTEYLKAEKDLAGWLGQRAIEDEEFKESIAHLSPLDRLRASGSRRSSVEYLKRKSTERDKFIYLKRLSTQGKTAAIRDHINNFLESGEKLLVFGWFVDTQLDFTKLFPGAVHALGKDTPEQRIEAIDKFQNDPKCKLMIASLKVLGIGVNLTAASHVAFIELGWTPADHDQAEDRLHRIGQTMPVNPYYYIAERTVEIEIMEIIERKRAIISQATDGDTVNSEENILKLLAISLLKKYQDNQ